MNDYLNPIREVASAHLEDIELDLTLARAELEHARGEVKESEARVNALQALIDLVSHPTLEVEAMGRLTLHAAMAEVLRTAPEHMMRAGDLAAEIQRRRLYQMRDGRAVEPQQIHARVGHYGELFEKVGTFIRLRDSDGSSGA